VERPGRSQRKGANVNFVTHFDHVECIIEDIGEDKMKTRSNSREKSCDAPDFDSFASAVKVDALRDVGGV
jgi:hypothetical protein